MLDHVGVRVSDYSKSKAFYEAALAPLDTKPVMGQDPIYYGFGKDGKAIFWMAAAEGGATTAAHIAFTAQNKEEVDAFYAAAIAAGGKDNGAPGVRKEYHPNYYGAFVLDADGNNIEAVIHNFESQE